jgi:MYXO-CTERM domain-containing protein
MAAMRRILSLVLPLLFAPATASAFCGFYVGGADTKLYNNATQVVLMRDGTRTVLSMQNNYQGPPSGFAMVVPVPVVLQKENVKTLPKAVFDHVDQLSAPRLVEYWEQDPCAVERDEERPMKQGGARVMRAPPAKEKAADDLGVTVEAQFTVGEYEIVILSAKDSTGLDTWIRREGYKIPDGAEPYLRPYVQAGSKFFVAKVDPTKVKFDKGMATLSPLRFHYDADTFSLPVRLGLMNSGGTQDLIVNILAKGQRYEVANYPNATIPTNFDVAEGARGQFGAFYAALFDRTLETIPKAVVTEYSWDASSCDPCPSPPLDFGELATLGGDVLPGAAPPDEESAPKGRRGFRGWGGAGFVVTRLHARYAKNSLGEDLVFRAAAPISGGREVRDDKGALEHGSVSASMNNFQGRYAIRHPWTGPIKCKTPQRGIWGGPPGGVAPKPSPAVDTAFAPRGQLQLATIVKGALPDATQLPGTVTPLGTPVVQIAPQPDTPPTPSTDPITPPSTPPPPSRGCGCEITGGPGPTVAAIAVGSLALLVSRLRRRIR